MIQRIQSLYLLIVVLLCAMLFLFPVFIKIIPANIITNDPEISFKVNVFSIEKFENKTLTSSSPNFLLLGTNAAAGITSLIVIFLYRKRLRQIMLCRLSILFILLFIVADFFYLSDAVGKEYGPVIDPDYYAGSYFPFIQVILLVMAIRAIKKDEELVKSADRIR